MAYCTTQEVVARMAQGTSTSTDLLSRIDDAIPAAELQINSDTGRPLGFEPSTATKTFRSPGHCYEIDLPDFTAITSFKIDDDDDGVFETTIAEAGYELDGSSDRAGWPYDSVRLLDRSFPYGGRRLLRVQVAATWGWAAVPAPINQACALLVVRLIQRPQAPFGLVSFGDAGTSSIRNTDPDYLHLIGPYRKPAIA